MSRETLVPFKPEGKDYGKLASRPLSVRLPEDVTEFLMNQEVGDRTAMLRAAVVEYIRPIIKFEKSLKKG